MIGKKLAVTTMACVATANAFGIEDQIFGMMNELNREIMGVFSDDFGGQGMFKETGMAAPMRADMQAPNE